MRSISSLRPPLAVGRTAQIYAWSLGWVVKLYNADVGLDDVVAEQGKTQFAHSLDISTPDVGDRVELEDRCGLLLERLHGVSGMQPLEQGVDVGAAARQLADLQLTLHERHVTSTALPLQSRVLHTRVANNDLLQTRVRDRLLERLRLLPEDQQLCHGDFHPGNLVHTERGPVIVGWIDATRGAPMADVTRSLLLFRGYLATAAQSTEAHAAMNDIITTYEAHYLNISGHDTAMIDAWFPILAAARLREGIGEQQDWLLAQTEAI